MEIEPVGDEGQIREGGEAPKRGRYINERCVKAMGDGPNGSADTSWSALAPPGESDNERRLGIDWGRSGSACTSSPMVVMQSMRRVSVFCM